MIIQENVPLKPFNTFGIAANARHLAHVSSEEGLTELLRHAVFRNQRRLILGGGSNILFTKDYDGLVVKVEIMGTTVIDETAESVLLTVGAGEVWHPFVVRCLQRDWGGIENLSLIPGTVGAAPIQNIGAYGVEIQRVIHHVDGVDLETGDRRRFTHEQCRFGYRESLFKHELREKFLISSITLRLTKKKHHLDTHYGAIQEVLQRNKINQATIRDVSDAVIAIRRSKLPDPAQLGNAGSFFKNPQIGLTLAKSIQVQFPALPLYPVDSQTVKVPAGWLIEQCGWKGKKIGRVGVHDQQALVLVNFGDANGEEIFQLATKIQESVKEKFGISLTTEVNII